MATNAIDFPAFDPWYAFNPPTCTWTEDSQGGWEATCGETWYLESGTPAENHYRYCPGCGRVIVVKQQEEQWQQQPAHSIRFTWS